MRQSLQAAAPGERLGLLEAHVREQIARVLGFAPAHIGHDVPFPTLGFDSLMAIEFRNRLEASLELNLPTTIVWTCPTVATLSLYLAEKLNLSLGAEPAAAGALADHEDDLASVEHMSQDELAALLEQELENLRSLTNE
jgi:acyl carrier protein